MQIIDGDGDVLNANLPVTLEPSNAVYGTSGADTMSGTANNDYLVALAANDTVNGLAGHDYLYGGLGNDILNGGVILPFSGSSKSRRLSKLNQAPRRYAADG